MQGLMQDWRLRYWHKADMLNALKNDSLLGAKRTVTNRRLPISIYEYTALTDAAYA
jgi:hypothetical protein